MTVAPNTVAPTDAPEIASVGICVKAGQPQAAEPIRELVKWLGQRNVVALVDSEAAHATGGPSATREALAAKVDLLVAFGGDGTLLSVARAAGTRRVPIMGVNLGRLGFLTEVNVDEMFPALERVFSGDVEIVSRMRIEVVATRQGREIGRYQALNDAVINKKAISRMIDLEAFADGLRLTSYYADGLIVSTPTGSTAYSLSAGGPLLMPGLEAIVLTPICPHALTQRPVVLPETARVELVVHTLRAEAALTVDGQEGLALSDGDRITIGRSPHPALIVSTPFRTRYEILHEKLRWGQR